MAVYTHELNFVLSEQELLAVYKGTFDGSDVVQLDADDYHSYFDFSNTGIIKFDDSLSDLFLDLEIGFISFSELQVEYDFSNLISYQGYIFRNQLELDAYNSGDFFSTDFHSETETETEPDSTNSDLSIVVSLLNEIKAKQYSDFDYFNSLGNLINNNIVSLADSLSLVSDSVDFIRTTVSQLPDSALHTDFHNQIVSKLDLIDFESFDNSLEAIKTYTDSLEDGVAYLSASISNLAGIAGDGSINSLDGQGCEFKDGATVICEGRDTVYTVASSRYFLLDDTSYTALYVLTSPTGETLNAPEALLSRYVTNVTTP